MALFGGAVDDDFDDSDYLWETDQLRWEHEMNSNLYWKAKAAEPTFDFARVIDRDGPGVIRMVIQTDKDHVVLLLNINDAVKMGVDLIQAAWPA